MQNTNSPRDPVNQLAPKQHGAPPADDHDRAGPPAPEVVARGYEADGYDNKSVLSVPLLVVLFFVLAFGTVTVIFYFIAYPKAGDPRAHPGAVARNRADLNERLDRIGRGKEVDQPRLEPLRVRSGPSHSITRPEIEGRNSPELHPEDLRITKDRFPALYGAGGMGIDKTLGLNNDELSTLFPAQKPGAGAALFDSQHVPSASNAGRGFGPSQAVSPPLPQGGQPEIKKDEKKDGKPEDKKDQKKDTKQPMPPDPKGGKQ